MKSLQELAQIIKGAYDAVHAQEKFLVPSLAIRASKAAEQYPYDQSIVTVAQVLNKQSEDTTFITRAELNSLYDKLYTHNTKLGEVFKEELGRDNLVQGPKFYNRANEGQDPVSDYERVQDPVLANALEAAFDGSGEYKPYSPDVARRAEKICNAGLIEIGLAPKKVSVFAGQEDLILCQATYETPKGQSSVIVPVEIKNSHALMPTMFLGQDSFVDLKDNLLKEHIVSTAGKSFKVDGEGILKVLSTAKNGVSKVASDVEMAAVRLRSEKAGSADLGGIVGLHVDNPTEEVKEPEYEKSAEHFEFANRVTSADGAARFLFNDRVVDAGRDIIIRKMSDYGYKNVQVKVADCGEDEIKYAIGVGVNAGIMAPVKIQGNNVFPPKVAVASGKIKSFSKDGISELVNETRPDTRMIAASSMSAGLKPTDLVQQVKDAVSEGNLIKAEDAINVLGEVDKHAQKVAIAILMRGLSDPMGASGNEAGNYYGLNSQEIDKKASEFVNDTPIFNTYNIFYPVEE